MKKGVDLYLKKFLLSVAVAVLSVAIAFSIGWASTTVQGQVTLIDWCSGLVFIDNVPFNSGSVDSSGITPGDSVKVTYSDTTEGKVIESIQKLQ